MARKKKEDEAPPLDKILAALDKKVTERGKAALAEVDASAEIARLTSEARRKGATMSELTQHVRRMDKKERELKPVTRQAIDIMLAVHDGRRPARTTRESRKRRSPVAGSINIEALK